MQLYDPLSSSSSADADEAGTDEGNEGDEGTTRGDKEVALRRTHLFECPPMNALFDASHRLHTLLQEEKHGEQCDVDSLVFLHTCESLC